MYMLRNDHHNKSSSHPSLYIVTNLFSCDENLYNLLEGLGAGEEVDNRGRDGWMASLTCEMNENLGEIVRNK